MQKPAEAGWRGFAFICPRHKCLGYINASHIRRTSRNLKPAAMSVSSQSPLLSPELLAQLERLELVSRKIFRGRMKGERRSKRKGQSVEFADFPGSVPGHGLRFIDW